jgi:branched-chain amino acid transport system substrate-binding protein
MKDVTDPQWEKSPDFVAWKAFMAKYNPAADVKDQATGYAFIVAHGLVEVLKRCKDDLTRENIMKQAASLQGYEPPLLLPGIKVNTSATDFYPIQSEQMSVFKGERFELFGNLISFESK